MSDKYGMGYILTNNACGVYFNDTTKLLMSFDGTSLDYFSRD